LQIFQKTITVTKNDLDQRDHVNNVRYVQWVQDIAEAHWLKNTTLKINELFYWVLAHHSISYKGEAKLGDTILLKTFVTKSEGVTSIRQVEMYNKTTDKLIIISETKWCLINTKTQRPARITPGIANLFK
jgi:acyl-CoA thioester hydrolase